MDSAHWQRVQTLFHAAVEMPEAERRPWLEGAAAGDAALVEDVMRLLVEDEAAGALDRGLAPLADAVLDPPSPHRPAETFGPYRIVRLLGEGGMGTVYLAERTDLGSRVAIKFLREVWPSPARRERFAAEQRILARLNHPSIAQLHDAGMLPDGTPWFVMEYVDGVPLTEYCRTHATTIEGRLELMRLVCEGVRHAHQHAVIHRDLKPSNILVTADGTVKLLDFGIAKHLESTDGERNLTRTGLRPMTLAYAAPEQIRGDEVGTYSDVYSLGVILYELLAGHPAFDVASLDPADAVHHVLSQTPDKPSVAAHRDDDQPQARADGHISWPDLDVLCLTAMHKDPARRYRTVDGLVRDIGHYLAGEPLDARPDSIGYRLGKFVRRHQRAVTAAAVALLVVIALTAFYTFRLAQARNAALSEAARAQRLQQFMLALFKGGESDTAPAGDLRVVTLVERGVKEARSLDAEPEVQADLYETLGGLYHQLGDLTQADALLTSALERHRVIAGADSAAVGRDLIAQGLLRSDQAQFDDAERLTREGLAMARRHRPGDHAEVRDAIRALGRVLQDRGQYAPAIAALEEAVKISEARGGSDPELAPVLYELASAHFYAGHYAEATTLNQRMLAMYRERYGQRHPLVAAGLVNLGAIEFEGGRYTEAERYYREALAIVQAWYGKDHPEVAADLTMLARALVYQSRAAEAVPLLGQALAIRERVYGPNHPQVASSLNELGNIAVQRDDPAEAERSFSRMVEIYRTAYKDRHYLIGTAQSNLASVYMGRGENQRAETLFREAIRRFGETLAADHVYIGIARIKLGRSLLRQQKHEAAATESLAGYEILRRQAEPSVSFLTAARRDLAAAYDALGRGAEAERFRAELAAKR
jgi:serine/threonine protein kinase/tetratricopeptide (TPR) repeat protein